MIVAAAVCLGGLISSASARAGGSEEVFYFLNVDQLEQRWQDGANVVHWDLEGFVGGDTNRIWYRSEGDQRTSGPSGGDFELQLLYSRRVFPFWDFQIGAARDEVFGKGPDHARTRGVIGFDGLAPYFFEVEPAIFIGDGGDLSARVTITKDVYVTQRLIAQPRFEINAAAHNETEFGVASGVNNVELGLRLRYEVLREVAPYVGVSWIRKLGGTANLARDEGLNDSTLAFVAGVRLWF